MARWSVQTFADEPDRFVLILVLAAPAPVLAVAWAMPPEAAPPSARMLAGLCRPIYEWIARLVRGRGSLPRS